jgi:hypothetical protein
MNSAVYQHLCNFNDQVSKALISLDALTGNAVFPADELQSLADRFRQIQSRTNAFLTGIIMEHETGRSADLLQLRFKL